MMIICFDFSDIAKHLIDDNKPMNGNHYILIKGNKWYDFARGANCINGIYVLTQYKNNSYKYNIIFTNSEKDLVNISINLKIK